MIQGRSQSVDVRSLVHSLPVSLLGGEVGARAKHLPGLRQAIVLGAETSQAKVREHRLASWIDQHIAWFEVAVEDSQPVSVLKPCRDTERQASCQFVGKRSLSAQELAQRLAMNERHGQPGHPLLDTRVDQAHDVGVIQLSKSQDLPAKATELYALRARGEEHLQRHLAGRVAQVEGTVDRAVGASPELLDRFVGAQSPDRHRGNPTSGCPREAPLSENRGRAVVAKLMP